MTITMMDSVLAILIPLLILAGVLWGFRTRKRWEHILSDNRGLDYRRKKALLQLNEIQTSFANLLTDDGGEFKDTDTDGVNHIHGLITILWRGKEVGIGSDAWRVDGDWVPFSTFLRIITKE